MFRSRFFMRARFSRAWYLHLQGAKTMRYWLMKSEPDEVSFDDVLAAPGQTVAWFGVRNYQAKDMCPFKRWTSYDL
jgi:hypothetical protein